MARVVVIGAGVGGLAAAARLAAQGHRVELHERAGTHGGKLGEYRRDGFTFDTGPSLLTLPQVFTDLFAATGGAADLELEPVDPVCGYRFADGTRARPAVRPRRRPGGARRRPRPRRRRGLAGAARPVRPAVGPRRRAGAAPAPARPRPRAVQRAPARPAGGRAVADPAPARRADAARPAAAHVARPVRDLLGLGPAPHPVGAVGDARTSSSASGRGGCAGACGASATRCSTGAARSASRCTWAPRSPRSPRPGGGCRGVRLADGRDVPADVVVSDADARVLYDRLLPGRSVGRRAAPARAVLRRAPASLAGFVLLLALDRRPAPGPPTASVPGRLRRRVRRAVPPARRPVPDPTVYVHAPDDPAHGARRTARRGSCWSTPRCTTRPAASTGTRPACAERYADRVLEVLARPR